MVAATAPLDTAPLDLDPPAAAAAGVDEPPPRIWLGPAEQPREPIAAVHPALRRPMACWDLEAAPHCLVVGSTGGGKTAFARAIAAGGLRRGMRAWGLDGKEYGSFTLLKGARNVGAIEEHPIAMAELIRYLHTEMRRRYQTVQKLRNRLWRTRGLPEALPDWEEWIVFIDEYQSFLAMLQPHGVLGRKKTNSRLVDMSRRSRECRIHLLFLMQRPKANAVDAGLDTELKGNLGLRVALGEIDSVLSGMAFDDYSLAGQLSAGEHIPRGRGLLQVGTVAAAFQAAWIPDPYSLKTSRAERERVWSLLPPQDPEWEMWSDRQGLVLPDLVDDEDDESPFEPPPAILRPGVLGDLAADAGLTSLG